MGTPTSNHRPLRAGIAIMPFDGEEHRGTLGAIAKRKSDLAKVLVTNVHVVSTHRNNYTVTGNESIYQGGRAEGYKVGQLYTETVNGVEKKSWVEGSAGFGYPVDAAALALPTGADIEALTSFNVHFPNDDDNNHTHVEKRPIVGPAVDPTSSMRLIAVGAGGGLRTFTVLNPNPSEDLSVPIYDRHSGSRHGTFYFEKEKNFTISQKNEPSRAHDSGSPILWVDEHGNYRIVGIHFAGKNVEPGGPSVIGYASRASAIEEELGITFGIKRPTAVATAKPAKVSTGATVTLDGSRSQSNEVLRDVLQYKWEKQASLTDKTLTQVATTRAYTFQTPNKPGTQIYKLTVTDGFGAKHTDRVTVTVKLANAGPPQTVNQKARVSLGPQGAGIASVGSLTYTWKRIPLKGHSMPPVQLRGDKGPRPWFHAPSQAGKLKFHLTVSDKKKKVTDTDDVEITVRAAAPTPKPKKPAKPTPPPTTPKPTPAPAPTTITASSTTNSVTVTWSAVTGATGYVLQLGKMEEDEVVGYDDFPTTGLSYTVTNLHSTTRYYYRVKSKNAAGEGSPSPVASLLTKTPPPKPTPKPPPVTHVWSHSSYTGCGPNRKEIQACSNGHSRHTRTVSASDPLIWYDWEYTGRTHYDDADGKLYKEQRRTSHCGDTETRWVAS